MKQIKIRYRLGVRKMKTNNYVLAPFTLYSVLDNGALAPKGSTPYFVPESKCMTALLNPYHPLVQGYIVHSKQKADEILDIQKINITLLNCIE